MNQYEREENGVFFTLYRTSHVETNNLYSIQLNTDFPEESLESCGYKITTKPESENEKLHLQLFVRSGNYSHIKHDFEIGFFPNEINSWDLEIEYVEVDTNTVKDKKVKTVQAESEAEPRPVIEGMLG
ncbi:MAG: hypothetical protein AB8B56_19585 [Crocinitomicaceae bacterium]